MTKKYPDKIWGSGYAIRDGFPNSFGNSNFLTGRKLKTGIKFKSSYNYSKPKSTPWVRCLTKSDALKVCTELKNNPDLAKSDLMPVKSGNQRILTFIGEINGVPVYVCTPDYNKSSAEYFLVDDKILTAKQFNAQFGEKEKVKEKSKQCLVELKNALKKYIYDHSKEIPEALTITSDKLVSMFSNLFNNQFSRVFNIIGNILSCKVCISVSFSNDSLRKSSAKAFEILIKESFGQNITSIFTSHSYIFISFKGKELNLKLIARDILDNNKTIDDELCENILATLAEDYAESLDWDNLQNNLANVVERTLLDTTYEDDEDITFFE